MVSHGGPSECEQFVPPRRNGRPRKLWARNRHLLIASGLAIVIIAIVMHLFSDAFYTVKPTAITQVREMKEVPLPYALSEGGWIRIAKEEAILICPTNPRYEDIVGAAYGATEKTETCFTTTNTTKMQGGILYRQVIFTADG